MLLQRSPGKNSWKQTKEQQSYRVLQEAVPHWDDSPKASHRSKSLSSFPISHWSPQSILALGFSTGHLTFHSVPYCSLCWWQLSLQMLSEGLSSFSLGAFSCLFKVSGEPSSARALQSLTAAKVQMISTVATVQRALEMNAESLHPSLYRDTPALFQAWP